MAVLNPIPVPPPVTTATHFLTESKEEAASEGDILYDYGNKSCNALRKCNKSERIMNRFLTIDNLKVGEVFLILCSYEAAVLATRVKYKWYRHAVLYRGPLEAGIFHFSVQRDDVS